MSSSWKANDESNFLQDFYNNFSKLKFGQLGLNGKLHNKVSHKYFIKSIPYSFLNKSPHSSYKGNPTPLVRVFF